MLSGVWPFQNAYTMESSDTRVPSIQEDVAIEKSAAGF